MTYPVGVSGGEGGQEGAGGGVLRYSAVCVLVEQFWRVVIVVYQVDVDPSAADPPPLPPTRRALQSHAPNATC